MENSLQSDLLNCDYLSMYLCFLLNKHLGVVFINLGFIWLGNYGPNLATLALINH